MKIPMKLAYQYMAIFFDFPPTSNHLYPLQVENCGSNSRLVVDEDDNWKFRPERVKATYTSEGKIKIVYSAILRPETLQPTLPPNHRAGSFMCHFNSPGSIQPCNHFGARNLLKTLSFLSYQVLIYA